MSSADLQALALAVHKNRVTAVWLSSPVILSSLFANIDVCALEF